MEIHFPMNVKMGKKFPLLSKTRASQNILHNSNVVSCCATKWAIRRANKPDFYEVLSLESKKVGFDEIKKAYRAMALQCHPDLFPPSAKEESTKHFIELKEAYETLSDPASRRIYDYKLGLVGSFKLKELCNGERCCFPQETWERQLIGLRKRSHDRMEKIKKSCM